jgi:hypothetical protein
VDGRPAAIVPRLPLGAIEGTLPLSTSRRCPARPPGTPEFVAA